jgi:electron transfer flavoprotein alpha subunit
MGGILVVGEIAPDGSLTKLSAEVATLARSLGEAGAGVVEGVVAGPSPEAAANELAEYLDTVYAHSGFSADHSIAPVAAALSTVIEQYDSVMLPASPDGRDLAGMLSALTGLGVLANATEVRWDGGPVTTHSVFGGKLITEGGFTQGGGIITIRPNSATAEKRDKPGQVQGMSGGPVPELPTVKVVDRIEAQSAAAPIEEARIIVSGGRGVGGPEGFKLVEEIAEALGGTVGATRAAVDAGWIPYAQQIGQTGKIVKPQLYLAIGISGAIQHKVGMQTAETVIAINRDPDAPIAEFADLVVIGDLFEVAPALLAELRARTG